MKKYLPAVAGLTAVLVIIGVVFGVSYVYQRSDKPISTNHKFDVPLSVDYSDTYENRNRKVFLTDTKFYFTSYSGSDFANGETPYIYDLKTGKIEPMLDFSVGDVIGFSVYDDRIYFTCYCDTSYDTDANWGYCLIEYCMSNGFVHRIYETPNTVQDISFVISGDKLIYTCGACPQDSEFDEYQLRIYDLKTEKETIVKKKLNYPCVYPAKNGAYCAYTISTMEEERTIYVSQKGKIEKSDFDKDAYYENHAENINDKYVSGKFGRYCILEDDMPNSSLESGDCGYSYKIKYYVYDNETQEMTSLVKAKYWFYYI